MLFLCDTRQQIFIQMRKNMEIFLFSPSKEKKIELNRAKDWTSSWCCQIYLSFFMWKSMKTYLHIIPNNLFSNIAKNNSTLLKICIIFTRSMKKYGSRGLKKHNHKTKSYFVETSCTFLSNKSFFYSNFSHENSTFFQ